MTRAGTLALVATAAVAFVAGQQLGPRPAQAAPPSNEQLAQRLAAAEAKLAQLLQVLQVSGSNVTLKAGGTLSLQGGQRVNASAGHELRLEAGGPMALKSGATMNVRSAGPFEVRGSLVRLNGGGRPIAYLGSKIASGIVSEGSKTVLVP